MRHYHGTPMGGKRSDVARFAMGRHFLIPFGRQEDLPTIAEAAVGFCFDNGAFSAWRAGHPIKDWQPYYKWCREWCRHPGFDFAVIPDVIDGTEKDNDALLKEWERWAWHPWQVQGVPVWHLHESFDRLRRLAVSSRWSKIAFGSSGEYATPSSDKWWDRISEAMGVVTDSDGVPYTKLHGLRMMDPNIFTRFPFASVDSTNVAQNKGGSRMYSAPHSAALAELIASRIEAHNSAATWARNGVQQVFQLKTEGCDD